MICSRALDKLPVPLYVNAYDASIGIRSSHTQHMPH